MNSQNKSLWVAGVFLVIFLLAAMSTGMALTEQFRSNQLQLKTIHIGSLLMREADSADVVTLVNRTDSASTGNYDSLDFPRGTTYTVPAGKELVITALCGVDLSGPAGGSHIELGYGDDAVADSGTGPTNEVTLISLLCTQENPQEVWGVIPTGKVPFGRSHSTGNWEATASGFIRDPL